MSVLEPILDVIYLTGPTASGKTEVAIELAKRIDAEILSLDSMAVYRHMNIGTAKPSPEQRQRVPHHLIDLVNPDESFSIAQYVRAAHDATRQLAARGKAALFVGGSPLYLKALLRGVFEGPSPDWRLRNELTQFAETEGNRALHRRLTDVDPASARRLHENDRRRIIRALEVHSLTGRPLSEYQRQFEHGRPPEACRVVRLAWPRPQLHERCDRRVDEMFERGLVAETEQLVARFDPWSHTARQAVGYRQVLDHLAGETDLAETVSRVKSRTRQFVRRQETWFRSLSECRVFSIDGSLSPAELADRLIEMCGLT